MTERLMGLLYLLPVVLFAVLAFWKGRRIKPGGRDPDSINAWGGANHAQGNEIGGWGDDSGLGHH
jgi:hypothetical protein